jgi:hypothetical protein
MPSYRWDSISAGETILTVSSPSLDGCELEHPTSANYEDGSLKYVFFPSQVGAENRGIPLYDSLSESQIFGRRLNAKKRLNWEIYNTIVSTRTTLLTPTL